MPRTIEGGHVHIRHITPSPLVNVGCYNPPPLRARRPYRHTRTTWQSGSNTILSHPSLDSVTRTSKWVTHLRIALVRTRLTSEFRWNPKPVSSQKASCHRRWACTYKAHHPFFVGRCGITILSALGPDHVLTVLFLGTHMRTSQWVSHHGIALARTRLTLEFQWNPNPVSSQKASYW
ncbi:hypothetical protein DVH24_029987 [Malus domestica]|uniref:Uncharacterized protein n=1 Tax=Malus domestica TaxID=3750 RepID=A0A498HUX8_MALDO|nr:hypothetical protein DVH24_029987 [Malus domestica]